MGKLLSSIVNERLVQYLNERHLISEFQAGFRTDYRTTDHMFVLHQAMKHYKDLGKKLHIAFIDFHKAFDKLWRIGLLTKLCDRDIGGNIYKLIKSMYSNNTSHVRVGTKLTDSFPCEIGVRQGDSLSPTLFNILVYVNDITDFLNSDTCEPPRMGNAKIGCLFYADDLVILSESQSGLQTSLNK